MKLYKSSGIHIWLPGGHGNRGISRPAHYNQRCGGLFCVPPQVYYLACTRAKWQAFNLRECMYLLMYHSYLQAIYNSMHSVFKPDESFTLTLYKLFSMQDIPTNIVQNKYGVGRGAVKTALCEQNKARTNSCSNISFANRIVLIDLVGIYQIQAIIILNIAFEFSL